MLINSSETRPQICSVVLELLHADRQKFGHGEGYKFTLAIFYFEYTRNPYSHFINDNHKCRYSSPAKTKAQRIRFMFGCVDTITLPIIANFPVSIANCVKCSTIILKSTQWLSQLSSLSSSPCWSVLCPSASVLRKTGLQVKKNQLQFKRDFERNTSRSLTLVI
jgi:hypothetical protein